MGAADVARAATAIVTSLTSPSSGRLESITGSP